MENGHLGEDLVPAATHVEAAQKLGTEYAQIHHHLVMGRTAKGQVLNQEAVTLENANVNAFEDFIFTVRVTLAALRSCFTKLVF